MKVVSWHRQVPESHHGRVTKGSVDLWPATRKERSLPSDIAVDYCRRAMCREHEADRASNRRIGLEPTTLRAGRGVLVNPCCARDLHIWCRPVPASDDVCHPLMARMWHESLSPTRLRPEDRAPGTGLGSRHPGVLQCPSLTELAAHTRVSSRPVSSSPGTPPSSRRLRACCTCLDPRPLGTGMARRLGRSVGEYQAAPGPHWQGNGPPSPRSPSASVPAQRLPLTNQSGFQQL